VVVQADLQDGRKSKRLNPNRAGEGGDSASRDGQEDALAGLAHRFPANGRLNLLPQTGRHGSPANGGLQWIAHDCHQRNPQPRGVYSRDSIFHRF